MKITEKYNKLKNNKKNITNLNFSHKITTTIINFCILDFKNGFEMTNSISLSNFQLLQKQNKRSSRNLATRKG